MSRVKSVLILSAIFIVAFAKMTLGATITEKRPVYNSEQVSPFTAYFQNQEENVNMDTYSLSLSVTDLVLPGRQGLDLVLGRTYTSNLANLYICNALINGA